MREPTPGRMVLYKSLTGYITPAVVAVAERNLQPAGVRRFEETGGKDGIPPLSGALHVHLIVFTAGVASSAPPAPLDPAFGGTYRQWDVPPASNGSTDEPWEAGTWAWPVVPAPAPAAVEAPSPLVELAGAVAELAGALRQYVEAQAPPATPAKPGGKG